MQPQCGNRVVATGTGVAARSAGAVAVWRQEAGTSCGSGVAAALLAWQRHQFRVTWYRGCGQCFAELGRQRGWEVGWSCRSRAPGVGVLMLLDFISK